MERISESNSQLTERKLKLASVTEKFFYFKKHHLDKTEDKLRLLDPMLVLKRGYTMLSHHGEVITSSKKLSKGDKIDLLFADGKASAEILNIKTDNNG